MQKMQKGMENIPTVFMKEQEIVHPRRLLLNWKYLVFATFSEYPNAHIELYFH